MHRTRTTCGSATGTDPVRGRLPPRHARAIAAAMGMLWQTPRPAQRGGAGRQALASRSISSPPQRAARQRSTARPCPGQLPDRGCDRSVVQEAVEPARPPWAGDSLAGNLLEGGTDRPVRYPYALFLLSLSPGTADTAVSAARGPFAFPGKVSCANAPIPLCPPPWRSCPSRTSPSPTAPGPSSIRCASPSARARRPLSSVRTAPASPPCCGCWPRPRCRTPGRSLSVSAATPVTSPRPSTWTWTARCRTWSISRWPNCAPWRAGCARRRGGSARRRRTNSPRTASC